MTDRRTREAIRYLGYGRNAVDERTRNLIADIFAELEVCAQVKWVYRIFEYKEETDGTIFIGPMKVSSKNLNKNLKSCNQVAMLAVTLGMEVDRRLKRYSVTDMPRAVVLQACAAAYLEEYCEQIQEKIRLEMKDKYLRPRFSPGYGDFDIKHQEDILRILETSKKIGLGRTESYMLIPTKSVTAIIGISNTDENCHKEGCEACEKTDCAYRRN